jgi:hypothetical protein
MNILGFPLWGLASSVLLFGGVLLALQTGPIRRRLVGLAFCQAGTCISFVWGWGVVSFHASQPTTAPTATAACWVVGVSMVLCFLAVWILGRRPWAEGLLAFKSPKSGQRRSL